MPPHTFFFEITDGIKAKPFVSFVNKTIRMPTPSGSNAPRIIDASRAHKVKIEGKIERVLEEGWIIIYEVKPRVS